MRGGTQCKNKHVIAMAWRLHILLYLNSMGDWIHCTKYTLELAQLYGLVEFTQKWGLLVHLKVTYQCLIICYSFSKDECLRRNRNPRKKLIGSRNRLNRSIIRFEGDCYLQNPHPIENHYDYHREILTIRPIAFKAQMPRMWYEPKGKDGLQVRCLNHPTIHPQRANSRNE